jgi:hypothetical protein
LTGRIHVVSELLCPRIIQVVSWVVSQSPFPGQAVVLRGRN